MKELQWQIMGIWQIEYTPKIQKNKVVLYKDDNIINITPETVSVTDMNGEMKLTPTKYLYEILETIKLLWEVEL